MGAFRVELGEAGAANYEQVQADLVLDLEPTGLLHMPIKPPGYVSADPEDETSIQAVVEELKEYVGTFEKPKYFDFDPSICAFGPAGQQGCTACIDSCPTKAITGTESSIEINPYLCQGGGVCAAVCPSGAIRYLYPNAADTLNRLRTLLKHYQEAGGQQPLLCLISEADYPHITHWPDHALPLVVEELASAGMDTWLSALAYGAQAVLLIDAGSVPESVKQPLMAQLEVATALLQGMGFDSDAVRLVTTSGAACLLDGGPYLPAMARATYAGSNYKREVMYSALNHLYAQSQTSASCVELPQASPFGTVEVNPKTCTLCMACTTVCPANALDAGGDVPKLMFIEANCVQCGLCQSACPEDAIQLHPRIQLDRKARLATVTLNEDRPLLCVVCGKPFATQSIVDSISRKLAGHAMFQTEQAKLRLLMCDDCRVVNALQDTQLMEATQAPIEPNDSSIQ